MVQVSIIKPNNAQLSWIPKLGIKISDIEKVIRKNPDYASQGMDRFLCRKAIMEQRILSSSFDVWQVNILKPAQFIKWQTLPDMHQIELEELYFIFLNEPFVE